MAFINFYLNLVCWKISLKKIMLKICKKNIAREIFSQKKSIFDIHTK